MKNRVLSLILVTLLLVNCAAGAAQGAEEQNAISEIAFDAASLPENMTIRREAWASRSELFRNRKNLGFPLSALFSQTIIYENERADVTYLLPPSKEWFEYGYVRLIQMDVERSIVLPKNGVIVRITASTRELLDRITYMLEADLLHYLKIRVGRLPKGWFLRNEMLMRPEELRLLGRELGEPIESALVQEFIATRIRLKARYYKCYTAAAAENLAGLIASEERALLERTVRYLGPVVVMIESQDETFNERAMALVNW